MADGDYRDMIENSVSSCEMVVLPKKRKKKDLKKRVIEKVNKTTDSAIIEPTYQDFSENSESVVDEKPQKKKFTFDIVSAQVITIFALIVTIMVTNIFWEDSGINNLLKGVFSNSNEETVDARKYYEFEAFSPSKNEIEVSKGVMTLNAGAIYAPCVGVVSDIVENDGKYTVTVEHSNHFKTIIKNADYTYFDVGETVYQQVPVCFASVSGEVLMYNDNSLVTNYKILDGNIVWEN